MSKGLLLAVLVAQTGQAQVQDEADADDPVELSTVTVEASKSPRDVGEIPGAVTVIDTARMEREMAQSIDDLVRYEPGIEVPDQGSRFGRAGFSIRGIDGNRIQVEIDGVSVSDAFSIGDFSNASRDLVDVDALKQVEILRGPSSALFGSDAMGGVVSFVTKDPIDYLGERSRYIDIQGGYYDADASLVAGATAVGRFGDGSGMFRVTRRDGEERNDTGADPLDSESTNLLAKLIHGVSGDGALELTLDRFQADSNTQVDSLEGSRDFSALFGFPYLIDATEVAANDERERTRLSLEQEWVGGRWGTDYLRWRMYGQDSRTRQDTFEARETRIFGQPSPVERRRRFRFDQDLLGLEINAASRFDTGGVSHELSYGIEFESAETTQIRDGTETDLINGEVSSQVGPDAFPVRDFPNSVTRNLGIYLQDRIELGTVTLVPGVRWDLYELEPEADAIFMADNPGIASVDLDESEISPKLAVLWDINDHWQLYGQYAEGFRAPPPNDVNVGFTNLQFGYTTLPNPDLESESSRGFELGVRRAGSRVRWQVSAFQTRYDDFIQSFQTVGFDPVRQLQIFQSVNIGDVEIEGVEFAGTWVPDIFPDGLSVSFSGALHEGEDRNTGLPIHSIAPLNGVLGLDYDDLHSPWGVSIKARGAKQQDDLDESNGALYSPDGYGVLDFTGYWRPTPATRLRLGLFNAFDRDYTAFLDVSGLPADAANLERFQRPGRSFSVAWDWQF